MKYRISLTVNRSFFHGEFFIFYKKEQGIPRLTAAAEAQR